MTANRQSNFIRDLGNLTIKQLKKIYDFYQLQLIKVEQAAQAFSAFYAILKRATFSPKFKNFDQFNYTLRMKLGLFYCMFQSYYVYDGENNNPGEMKRRALDESLVYQLSSDLGPKPYRQSESLTELLQLFCEFPQRLTVFKTEVQNRYDCISKVLLKREEKPLVLLDKDSPLLTQLHHVINIKLFLIF